VLPRIVVEIEEAVAEHPVGVERDEVRLGRVRVEAPDAP